MEPRDILLIVFTFVVAMGLLFFLFEYDQRSDRNVPIQPPQAPEEKTSASAVSITLKPVAGSATEFEVSINTHSGDLADFDLMEQATLSAQGRIFKPTAAPKLSGHHVTGRLAFDTGGQIARPYAVIIKGIPDIPDIEERVFTWS